MYFSDIVAILKIHMGKNFILSTYSYKSMAVPGPVDLVEPFFSVSRKQNILSFREA